MSEAPEKDSKTEEATEKKVRDSVEKGQIPVSREAPIFASMLALMIIMSFLMSDNVRKLTYSLARLIDDPSGIRLRNSADAVAFFTTIGMAMAELIIPIVIVLLLAGLASSILVTAPLSVGAAALTAWLFSLAALRTQSLQLMLVSLAFGGLLRAAIEVLPGWTGGNDGLPGIPPARFAWPGAKGEFFFTSPLSLFLLTAITTLLAYLAMVWLRVSPLGRLVIGIRDNATRVTALGVHTVRPLRHWVVICGALAGLAGTLHTYVYHFLSPTILGIEASLDALVMVVIGGSGNLIGSVIGAAVIFVVKEKLPAFTTHWPSILGVLYIVFALIAGRDSLGLFTRRPRPAASASQPGEARS